MGRRVSLNVLFVLCVFTVQVSRAGDFKTFSYGKRGDDLIKIQEVRGDQLRVMMPDGSEKQCGLRDVGEIGDLLVVADTAIVSLERAVLTLRNACDMLRQQLEAEFDDGYLEMMTSVLSMREKGMERDGLNSIMQESRERRLQGLVSECKAFDEGRFIALHKQCDFTEGFLDTAADQSDRERASLGRQKTWLDAQSQVYTGDEKQAAQKKSSDFDRAMQELAKRSEDIRTKKGAVSKARVSASKMYDHYEQTYQKATQFLATYAAIRERLTQGVEIGDSDQRVLATASDWARDLLQTGTRNATGSAAAARALLDRRRNPPRPKPPAVETAVSAQPAPRSSATDEKPLAKKEGCFIATAVYGSYTHPDVLTLRRFRDSTLVPLAPGRCFIEWYYKNGPHAAAWLNARPSFKPFVRVPLCTLVWGIRHPVLLLCVCSIAILLLYNQRKRRCLFGADKEVEDESAD